MSDRRRTSFRQGPAGIRHLPIRRTKAHFR